MAGGVLTLQELAGLAERHAGELHGGVASFDLGGRVFDFGRPQVMGVVNLSADSWYRESVCLSTESAVERGRVLVAQGATLVDVGAESTLEQAERVNAADQQARLLPVVKGLREAGVLVSVETYEAAVAKDCLEAGANVLNLTGPGQGEACYQLAAEHEAAVIICFVQGEHVRAVGDLELGEDPVGAMYEFFAREIDRAIKAGVERLFVDPGLGFYYRNLGDSETRVRHQMKVFLNSFRLRRLGWPVCHALPHAFEFFREEVRCAEPYFAVLAALGGTSLFRTHEVARTRAVLETMMAY